MNNSTKQKEDLPDSNWNRIYLLIIGFNAFLVIVFYIIRLIFNHPAA